MGSAGRTAYLCDALTARHRDDASSSPTAIGISHHVDTVVIANAAVKPRATTTPAAMRQSSPTMKSHQNAANPRRLLPMRFMTAPPPEVLRRLARERSV